jgi:hypothetical protein
MIQFLVLFLKCSIFNTPFFLYQESEDDLDTEDFSYARKAWDSRGMGENKGTDDEVLFFSYSFLVYFYTYCHRYSYHSFLIDVLL